MHPFHRLDAAHGVEHRLVALPPASLGLPGPFPERGQDREGRGDVEGQGPQDDQRQGEAEVEHQGQEHQHEDDVHEHEHHGVGEEAAQVLQFLDPGQRLHRGVPEVEGGGELQGVAEEPGEKRAPHRMAQGPVPRSPQHRLEGEEEQQAHDDHVEGGGAPVGMWPASTAQWGPEGRCRSGVMWSCPSFLEHRGRNGHSPCQRTRHSDSENQCSPALQFREAIGDAKHPRRAAPRSPAQHTP